MYLGEVVEYGIKLNSNEFANQFHTQHRIINIEAVDCPINMHAIFICTSFAEQGEEHYWDT